MSQLEPLPSQLDSSIRMGLMGAGNSDPSLRQISVSNMQMGPIGPVSDGSSPQQVSVSNMQEALLDPASSSFSSHALAISNQHMESQSSNLVSQQYLVHDKQTGGLKTTTRIYVEPQGLSISTKRKSPTTPPSNIDAHHKLSMPNKRMADMEHRPWLQQISAQNKRSVQSRVSNSPKSPHMPTASKKTIQLGSVPSKSGSPQLSNPKNQTSQSQPSPRNQSDSSESVRSKMRESLAAALALVLQQEKHLNPAESSQSDVASGLGRTEDNHQNAAVADDIVDCETCDSESAHLETSANGNSNTALPTSKHDGKQLQSSYVFIDEDVLLSDNPFAKDELLHGNGLSWALDPVTEVVEKEEIQTSKKQKLDGENVATYVEEQSTRSPQDVALEIEVELFKLFGGVNKKYKEKGRSLLFNLKDRNNPELRERVMAGEIPPGRLCSMTAEELASKELSEWRMAKAEELAQMVVLPDTEVDFRRLVKKNHKGEFQVVELQQDESVSVEVSAGASSFTQNRSKDDNMEPPSPSKAVGKKNKVNPTDEKRKSEGNETSCTITIPSSEGTDYMQGLMAEDELKDAEFLPPIVSLDEFMESLHSEPPFENLSVDAGKETPSKDKDNLGVGTETKAPGQTPQDVIGSARDENDKISNANSGSAKQLPGERVIPETRARIDNHVKAEIVPSVTVPKGEHVWEGLLQLNISATALVIGIFKSGEKASSREWPGMIEIKGRVRLDAFEKFLQELPMSRSRAVMVMHFVSKEAESGSLSEVIESYVMDGRVGFAEPGSGVELYFCPPHPKTVEMLSKILPKDQIEAINPINNGLVGVVVWRKPHLTTISPTFKHSSKKQHFTTTTRRPQDKDVNKSVNFTSKSPLPRSGLHNYPQSPPDDDDDDVPPGFGPGVARDDDDLPEFNFSGGSNPSGSQFSTRVPSRGPGLAPFHQNSQTLTRPVDQMRQLVQKYGQTETNASYKAGLGAAIQPWNDDDDDIPEWQPQAPSRQLSQPPHTSQQPTPLQPYTFNQHHPGLAQSQLLPHQQVTVSALQPPGNVMQEQPYAALSGQQGSWWGSLSGSHGRPPVGQPGGGQIYAPGQTWRQDAPKSRGF